MSDLRIKSALISVYHKDGLGPIVEKLNAMGTTIYSTGGTQKFIESKGVKVVPVEDLTSYPSILGGRVKTLHPKVFGGILSRRDHEGDNQQIEEYGIPEIDLVIVDLYPFEATVASGASEADIIEKIDIGGIALIRAAAKNFKDVMIVPSMSLYEDLLGLLETNDGQITLSDRKRYAAHAFATSSNYDTAIFNYFNQDQEIKTFRSSHSQAQVLRYGENPHQEGVFYGPLSEMFDQIHGKAISYNNLVDIDAAVCLIEEFQGETAFVIMKHTNACGMAIGKNAKDAYQRAFAADTISAFGGVLACSIEVDKDAAEEINQLFFEILIAPSFTAEALAILQTKKKRILLIKKQNLQTKTQFKSLLNGVIEQDRDLKTDVAGDLKVVTKKVPTSSQIESLLFASKVCKHTKSNTIILAKDGQLLASGVGQTSRVDALRQAIVKAGQFGFDLKGAVMASDAFFPFPDCVEIAHEAGIAAVIQPGGSIKDQLSIDFCDANKIPMVFTGVRHFKH